MAAGAGEGKEKGAGACELCGAAARVYCAADEATLCWGCDAQVHGANFLVARHARALLCRGCAQPTPWRAAGPRLGPTASLCERCVRRGGGHGRGGVGAGGDDEMAGEGDGREDEEEDEEEEGEGENQVVPWAEEAEATPPPVASSTSSSSREAAECAKEDVPCSTSQPSLCRYASSAHHGGRSDEATSSRNGGRFLASRHRKRSPSDFLSSGSAQSGSGRLGRNCSNAAIGRNDCQPMEDALKGKGRRKLDGPWPWNGEEGIIVTNTFAGRKKAGWMYILGVLRRNNRVSFYGWATRASRTAVLRPTFKSRSGKATIS